jgi:cellulase/cellobiase CelA1
LNRAVLLLDVLTQDTQRSTTTALGVAVPIRRAARTLVVVFALATAIPAGPAWADTPLPAPTCTATVWTVLRWSGGYQGTVTLTNTGPSPLHAWFVAWELPAGAALAQTWNGIAMVSGPTAMVHAPSWHSRLAPSGTVTAGFLATGEPPAGPPHTVCG